MTNEKLFRGSLFLLFAIAAGSMVFLVFLPRQRAIADLRRQIQDRKRYILESQSVEASIVTMEKDLADACSYIERRAKQAPADGDLDTVFGSIADEAKNAGVLTHCFQPQPDDNSETAIKRMRATLVTEGTFHQLFDFMARLEQLPRAFWIEELQLHHTDEDNDRLTCEMGLAIFADNRGNSD